MKTIEQNSKLKSKGLFPGSFAPFHLGHFEILKEALNHYKKVTILVAYNPTKEMFFYPEDRKQLIEKVIKTNNLNSRVDVKILPKNDRTAIFYKDHNYDGLIRGVRLSDIDSNTSPTIEIPKEEAYITDTYLEENPLIDLHFIYIDSLVSSSIIMLRLRKLLPLEEYLNPEIIEEVKKLWKNPI